MKVSAVHRQSAAIENTHTNANTANFNEFKLILIQWSNDPMIQWSNDPIKTMVIFSGVFFIHELGSAIN